MGDGGAAKKPIPVIRVTGNTLTYQNKTYRCAIGKGGFSSDKREGDGCTPVGTFPLRECWYRPDKKKPDTALPLKIITQNDGWCDDPKNPSYNTWIRLPLPEGQSYSFEQLWREDEAYDLIVPLGYNDDPIIPGKGSAIFMHVAKEGYPPTEGCVALAKQDLLEILSSVTAQTLIEINLA